MALAFRYYLNDNGNCIFSTFYFCIIRQTFFSVFVKWAVLNEVRSGLVPSETRPNLIEVARSSTQVDENICEDMSQILYFENVKSLYEHRYMLLCIQYIFRQLNDT